jgi:ATP-dependent RNA helicase RhlE
MLQRLSQSGNHSRTQHVRGLVVTPTRELAQQIEDAVREYGRHTRIRSVSIYGGVNMDNQLKHLRRGVDIVIATPGRLLDHCERKSIDLSKVEVLVLDEADRMLDMGFINDVRKIIGLLPVERQTLMFSATISNDIKELTRTIQKDPQYFAVGKPRNPAETITQHFYSVPQDAKVDLLFHVIEKEKMESVLVFSRTKHGADKITKRLARQNVNAIAIHSNRTQAQRQRALDGFKRGQFKVLVATDIAARGIDVDGISHVVNFDTPAFAEDYIHRIGRTGRAEAKGIAFTFVSRDEERHVRNIERFIGKRFEVQRYAGFTPSPRPTVTNARGQGPANRFGGDRHRRPAPRNRFEINPGRKRKPAPKIEAFSTDSGAGSSRPATGSFDWKRMLASKERKNRKPASQAWRNDQP